MSPFVDGAALVDLIPYAASLSVRGPDAEGYLQRMISADLRKLEDDRGLRATMMTPKGKLIAAFESYRESADAIRLVIDPTGVEALRQSLEASIILEEVEVVPDPGPPVRWSIQGPEAHAVCRRVFPTIELPETHLGFRRVADETEVFVVRSPRCGSGGWDLWCPVEASESIATRLEKAGASRVDYSASEAARIDGGYVRFGVDADATRLPPEAGYDDAISYDKGCYVGQEIVARIRTYGHVNWLLRRLRLSGETIPAPGTEVADAQGKKVGHVTSAASAPDGSGPVALAYVRHEVGDGETPLFVASTPVVLEQLGG